MCLQKHKFSECLRLMASKSTNLSAIQREQRLMHGPASSLRIVSRSISRRIIREVSGMEIKTGKVRKRPGLSGDWKLISRMVDSFVSTGRSQQDLGVGAFQAGGRHHRGLWLRIRWVVAISRMKTSNSSPPGRLP